jgi:hypothetical protein
MSRYLSDIVPISQLVFVIGMYVLAMVQTFTQTCCLAESGAGKTQFVKSLLGKVHQGIRYLFSLLAKNLDYLKL